MITIIIFAIIGLITGIILRKKHQIKIILLLIIFSSLLGYLIALSLPTKTITVVNTYKLVNKSEINYSERNYFLDIQNIDGTIKDVFYYEINNEYRMMKTDLEILQSNIQIILNSKVINKLKRNHL